MRASALHTDPKAEDGNRSSKSQGSTEGNGLLEPCEGKRSSTVLRGGSGGDAAPLPDTPLRISASTRSSPPSGFPVEGRVPGFASAVAAFVAVQSLFFALALFLFPLAILKTGPNDHVSY